VFLVHVLNYLYFFVDDEGIPFVFARHLLEGKGLAYNSLDGRVEGYSDFLQIVLDAGWLLTVRILGWAPISVFFIGKVVSIVGGFATVILVWVAMRREASIRLPGLVTGMAFLVLAPPLATWSCSSLEMASVTLLVTIITIDLFQDSRSHDRVTALAACLLVLLRIDGFVYAFALIAPQWLMASGQRRRELSGRLLAPLLIVGVVYNAWRVWYFGDVLPCPFAAKVLYKLHPAQNIVVHDPDVPYLVAFLRTYGILPASIGAVLVVASAARQRRTWPLLASAGLLVGYASLVGDWMVGFRFLLPVLPVTALLIAIAVASVRGRYLAWGLTLVACGWFGIVAMRAATRYDQLEFLDSWWASPSFDQARYFSRYFQIYKDLDRLVQPGGLIAYNQAGFVPYMLGVDNVEDLGVCTRFIARMPTTDVMFTEVGRYSPLTNSTALRAANAYLLYRSPDFIIIPLDNLRAANLGGVPHEILRGHYSEVFTDRPSQVTVYRRTADSTEAFQSTPHVFLENVAHPSHIRQAFDGEIIPPEQYLRRLEFLAGGDLDRSISGRVVYNVSFSETDVPIYELDLEGVWARNDVRMVLTLWNAKGGVVRTDTRTLVGGQPDHVALSWPDGPAAAQLSVELEPQGPLPTRVTMHDLRVQGQPPALAAHVSVLAFPPAAVRPKPIATR
jgi:hypothetical protein